MEIRGVSNNGFMLKQTNAYKSDPVENNEAKDKVEISTEAKKLAASELDSQRLNEIRNRINSKFYDSEDVLNKLAEKVLPELL
jgi:hypothetical protein